MVVIRRVGRKPKNVSFNKVCKALRNCLREDGSPNYSAAARELLATAKVDVSPAFIFMRVKREAHARGVPVKDLLMSITNRPKTNLDHIKEVYGRK